MMNFNELDTHLRVFETAHDHCVLPSIYIVARLDGRSFTQLTNNRHNFERPYDNQFRDIMVATVEHLMTCGFNIIYGYTQSDEISLLFHPLEQAFGRKVRKYNSILAGEASACFSLKLGDIGAFDCRISQLPTQELVVDYFRWRQADAHRNALNAHCYWLLRRQGDDMHKATARLQGLSVSDKNELLFNHGINFNDLPAWQKRGMGLYWESYKKEGYNPITDEAVQAERRRIKHDFELPMKDTYEHLILALLSAN